MILGSNSAHLEALNCLRRNCSDNEFAERLESYRCALAREDKVTKQAFDQIAGVLRNA